MQGHRRPEPFSAYTTQQLWDDPHISERMLAFHLDPDAWPASRPHAFIDRSVAWLVSALDLAAGRRLLDLGCGPGLYACRFAALGIEVLGVDVSRRSLTHARQVAAAQQLPARFVEGNYLEVDLGGGHDAAILVYEDFSALSPAQRALLLARVHGALKPGGWFCFDVTAAARFAECRDGVEAGPDLMDGFWAQPPYLGIRETWTYPELRLVLDRYTIERAGGRREFWNWMQCLTPEEVVAELALAGFGPATVLGDVAGAPYDAAGTTFAVLTQREDRALPAQPRT